MQGIPTLLDLHAFYDQYKEYSQVIKWPFHSKIILLNYAKYNSLEKKCKLLKNCHKLTFPNANS